MLACSFEQSPSHGHLRGWRERGVLAGVGIQIVKVLRRIIKLEHEFEASLAHRQNSRTKTPVDHPSVTM